jgi:beta-1,4-N-acetylglucosaminyltransferase
MKCQEKCRNLGDLDKMKVLIILGSGGHTAQMLKLLKLMGNKYHYEYVINSDDIVTPKKISGKIHRIPNPRVFGASVISKLSKTLFGFIKSFFVVLKFDVVISAGPGLSVPVFYAAKMLGKKTIFLESWSRAHSPSVSGRLCYPVSDLFFVQWPKMKKFYPKAIFAGRLG